MIKALKRYRIEIFIFAIAFIARLVLFSFNFEAAGGDIIHAIKGDDGYYELSYNLLAGNGFTFDMEPPYRPNPLRPPLWPVVIASLAGIFGSYWAVLIFEIIIGSFIPVIGYRISRYIIGGEKINMAVGIFLALEPFSALLSVIMYTETMFTFLFLLSVLYLARYYKDGLRKNLILTAIFMGFAIMVKPTIQYIPFILPFYILYLNKNRISAKIWKDIAVFCALVLVIVSPWLFRNYRLFGVFGVSAQPAFNLFIYLTPTVLSIDNGTNFRVELNRLIKEEKVDEREITLATQDKYKNYAINVIKEHKSALAKSIGMSLLTFFTHDGILTVFSYAGHKIENNINAPALNLLLNDPIRLFSVIGEYVQSSGVFILIGRLLWISIAFLFMIGSSLLIIQKKLSPIILSALFLIFYFALTTTINGWGVNARFRVPVNTFILVFAFYGFVHSYRMLKDKIV